MEQPTTPTQPAESETDLPTGVLPIHSAYELRQLQGHDVGATPLDDVQAKIYTDRAHRRINFLMDERTAAVVVHAIRLMAADEEAHAREVRRVGDAMPIDSYGARNRLQIAQRKERIAARLRAVDYAYRSSNTHYYWGI